MTQVAILGLMAIPWCGAGWWLLRGNPARSPRPLLLLVMLLVAGGCLGLAHLELPATVNLQPALDPAETVSIGNRLSWTADRFSLVMVAALMVMTASSALLSPQETPSTSLLLMILIALLPLWWWTESVWALAGLSVLTAWVTLLFTAERAPRSLVAGRTVWLLTATGDLLLVMALVAGAAGLGRATVTAFGDPIGVEDFAAMRPATAMFVAFWSWLAVWLRAFQFPWCVSLDRVAVLPRRGWVCVVGLGVFAVAHRWADLHRGWWAAAPSITNLILSAALASALFCAWFAWSSRDLRVRVAYLTAAQFSLVLGPLTSGGELDRVWAAAVLLGTLSLAMWLWSVIVATAAIEPAVTEARPAWVQLLAEKRLTVATPVSHVDMRTEIPAAARGGARLLAILWCGLTISAGSWWWEAEPIVEAVASTDASEDTALTLDTTAAPVQVRPQGRELVSAAAVVLMAMAVINGVWSTASASQDVGITSLTHSVSIVLCCLPSVLVVLLAHPDGPLWKLTSRWSPGLAGIGMAAMVIGGFSTRWATPTDGERGGVLTVLQQMGQNRLSIPALLQVAIDFPLSGLAQLFRFLNTAIVETCCESTWRQLPDALRTFHAELRPANKHAEAFVLFLSGVALVTTLVWLAQAGP